MSAEKTEVKPIKVTFGKQRQQQEVSRLNDPIVVFRATAAERSKLLKKSVESVFWSSYSSRLAAFVLLSFAGCCIGISGILYDVVPAETPLSVQASTIWHY